MASKALDEAQANLNAERKRTLQAMAQGGSAAVAGLAAADSNINSSSRTALDQAALAAAGRGAPAAAQPELAGIISSGSAPARTAIADASASAQRDSTAMQGVMGGYMDQASAAIPVIRADADRQVGLMKTAWEEQRRREEEERQLREREAMGLTPEVLARGMAELNMANNPQAAAIDAELQRGNAAIDAAGASRPEDLQGGGPQGTAHPAGFRRTEDGGVWESPDVQAYHEARESPEAQMLMARRQQLLTDQGELAPAPEVSPEVTAQRAAFEQLYGDELGPQAAAAAAGLFPSNPEAGMSAEDVYNERLAQANLNVLESSGGMIPDVETYAKSLEDPDRPEGILRAEEAGQYAGLDADTVAGIQQHPAFETAINTIEDYLAGNVAQTDEDGNAVRDDDGKVVKLPATWGNIEGDLRTAYEDEYGHSFDRTLALVREMYADKIR